MTKKKKPMRSRRSLPGIFISHAASGLPVVQGSLVMICTLTLLSTLLGVVSRDACGYASLTSKNHALHPVFQQARVTSPCFYLTPSHGPKRITDHELTTSGTLFGLILWAWCIILSRIMGALWLIDGSRP